MNMPVMNGEQTYEKLQQMAPQVKVIGLLKSERGRSQRSFWGAKAAYFFAKTL